MLTVSVDGGGVVAAGLIVSVALRVTPLSVALIVAVPVVVTEVVPIVNVPEDAPREDRDARRNSRSRAAAREIDDCRSRCSRAQRDCSLNGVAANN